MIDVLIEGGLARELAARSSDRPRIFILLILSRSLKSTYIVDN